MIIKSAYIKLVEKAHPIEAKINLGNDDLISSCEITGGEVSIEDDTDILFKGCYIEDCEYSIKGFEGTISLCPFIDSCIIRDCKLPRGYYIDCVFENDGKRECSAYYSCLHI